MQYLGNNIWKIWLPRTNEEIKLSNEDIEHIIEEALKYDSFEIGKKIIRLQEDNFAYKTILDELKVVLSKIE